MWARQIAEGSGGVVCADALVLNTPKGVALYAHSCFVGCTALLTVLQ
jgi:hypothetical protein